MEPTTILDSAGDLFVFAAIAIGITQLVKEAGVQGNWLRTACVVVAALVWSVMTFLPVVWEYVVAFVVALSTTGLVAFTDDRLQKLKSPR